MAVTDSPDTDSARLAEDEVITTPETSPDYGWYTEFELRGYMKREFSGSDFEYWVGPNVKRAQYYDPFEIPDEVKKGYGCDSRRGSDAPPLHSDHKICRRDAANYENRLRDLPQFEVYDDRVVVPLEVIENLEETPVEGHDYSEEFRQKILLPLTAHMPMMEDPRRDYSGHGVEYDGEYPFFQTFANYYSDRDMMDQYEVLRVLKPDPRPVYVRVPPEHPMSELYNLYQRRRKDGRTLLASIVARDAATGTGKTTLAVQLAKTFDQNGWTAERATLDPDEYADLYTAESTPSQSCIILDEAEQAADNRRSSSHQNVKLSHLWATMRFREIYSLTTLPSASMLDKRLKELADLYIVVIERGVAVVYETKVDDTEGDNFLRRLHRIRWEPLDDDPEYKKLTRKKAERMENYAENYAYGDDDEDDIDPDKVRNEAELEKRNEIIERMAGLGYRQEDIAEAVGLDRSTVSRILNS